MKRLWAARHDPASLEPVKKEVFLLARSWFQRLIDGGVPAPESAVWWGDRAGGAGLSWSGRLQSLYMALLLDGTVDITVLDHMSGVVVHQERHAVGPDGALREVPRSPPGAAAYELRKPAQLPRRIGGRK
jgi:hypothetical protein